VVPFLAAGLFEARQRDAESVADGGMVRVDDADLDAIELAGEPGVVESERRSV